MPATDEYITINGVDLSLDRCWRIVDLSPLYDKAPVRGEDVTVPGTAGQTAKTRIRDAMQFSLPMIVFGFKDRTGATNANPRLGLKANLDYLNANVLAPYSGSDTVTLTHTFEDATSRSAACIVIPPMQLGPVNMKGHSVRAVLDIIIPSGQLT